MVSHFLKPGLFRRRLSASKVISFNVVTCQSAVDFLLYYGARSMGLQTGGASLRGFGGWAGLPRRSAYHKTKVATIRFLYAILDNSSGR